MTSRQDTAERLWLKLTSGRQEAPADKAAELRMANTARLRQARLSKEAELAPVSTGHLGMTMEA